MALTARYANFDLKTGANDGTSEADAWRSWSDMASGYAAGQRVYIKQTSSPHAMTGGYSLATDGSSTAPLVFEGYADTPGDGGLFYMTASSDTLSVSADYVTLKGLHLSGSGGGAGLLFLSTAEHFQAIDCLIAETRTSATTTFGIIGGTSATTFIGCVLYNSTTSNNSACITARNCTFHRCAILSKNRACVVNLSGYPWMMHGCVVAKLPGLSASISQGLDTSSGNASVGGLVIDQCSFYGWDTHVDLNTLPDQADGARILFSNSVFYDGTYGIRNQDASKDYPVQIVNCAAGGFTTARYDGLGNVPALDDVTLTQDPYMDVSLLDFRLNDAPGGGRACRAMRGRRVGAEPVTDFDYGLRFPAPLDIGALGRAPEVGATWQG